MTTAGYKHFDRGYKNIDVESFHGDIALTSFTLDKGDSQG